VRAKNEFESAGKEVFLSAAGIFLKELRKTKKTSFGMGGVHGAECRTETVSDRRERRSRLCDDELKLCYCGL
jgi:hypothetical protein